MMERENANICPYCGQAVNVKLDDSSTAVVHWGVIERRMSLKRKAVD